MANVVRENPNLISGGNNYWSNFTYLAAELYQKEKIDSLVIINLVDL
jgi:hypothetical protein